MAGWKRMPLKEWRLAGAALVDLVLPGECAGCAGDPGEGALLCPGCRLELSGPARPAWPTPVPAGLPPPWAVADYDGAARGAILAHKEDGRYALCAPLGDALARSVLAGLAAGAGADPTGAVALVPVPSRRTAVRGRGQDADAATHPPGSRRRSPGRAGRRGASRRSASSAAWPTRPGWMRASARPICAGRWPFRAGSSVMCAVARWSWSTT